MDDPVIEFNVGGVFYTTQLSTVKKEPGKLAEMFSQGKQEALNDTPCPVVQTACSVNNGKTESVPGMQ